MNQLWGLKCFSCWLPVCSIGEWVRHLGFFYPRFPERSWGAGMTSPDMCSYIEAPQMMAVMWELGWLVLPTSTGYRSLMVAGRLMGASMFGFFWCLQSCDNVPVASQGCEGYRPNVGLSMWGLRLVFCQWSCSVFNFCLSPAASDISMLPASLITSPSTCVCASVQWAVVLGIGVPVSLTLF